VTTQDRSAAVESGAGRLRGGTIGVVGMIFMVVALARVSQRRGTPHVGVHVQVVLSVLVLAPFVLTGADVLGNLFPAIAGIFSLSLVAMMIGCCGSVVVAAVRGKVTESRWQTIVAPAIAGAGLLLVMVIIASSYSLVTGSDALVIALTPAIPVLAALYGALAAHHIPVREQNPQ
jgi:hypothetical protein